MKRAYLTAITAEIHCPYCHACVYVDDVRVFSRKDVLRVLDGRQSVDMLCGVCSGKFNLHEQSVRKVL